MKRNKSIKMYCEDERLFMFENQFSITKKQSGYTGFYSNVLFFDSPDEREHTNHPFQKPVDLLKFLIQVYTREGDTVLDPFMGSGTTGVACQKTNRHFIGVERDAEYYRIAQERIDRI
jgi:site-specific DNA-methyltransferase (adenine-specific)